MMTGAMTSRVAAMVRFQLTWWAPLKVSSPYDSVHADGFSLA